MTNILFDGDDALTIDPPETNYADFACEICGTSLTYSGKGRKPKKCTPTNGGNPECFSTRVSTPRTGTSSARTEAKVTAALAVMAGTYQQLIDILIFVSPRASMALAERIPVQQATNKTAFEASPKLCERVVSMGGKGGTLMFAFTNLAMMAMVGRIAYADIQSIGNAVNAMNGDGNGEAKLEDLFANLLK